MKTRSTHFQEKFPWGSAWSRHLFLLSFVLVILLPAYNAAFVYPSLIKLFKGTTTDDATRIARHFLSMVGARTGELTQSSLDSHILKQIEILREDFGLAKLKIFSRTGEILFSTDSQDIGKMNKERYFREIVAQGKVHSEIIRKDSDSLERQRMPVDVVETYVPMMKDGRFLGALEIYYDITQTQKSVQKLLRISFLIVIVLALSVLFLAIVGIFKEKRRLMERRRAENEREQLIEELQEALSRVRTLSGLLPICSSCKKIRDDRGYWNQIEAYISDHSEAEFTHGICPECMKNLYGISMEDTDSKRR
jgi:hypothetical protein